MWVTHTWNLVEFRKTFFFDTPIPPRYPQVPPLGMTQAAEWKSHLICFVSFICEKIHKVWFKNLWNWLCNSDLMIFDLLAPPQGPRAREPKKWRRCVCHSCKKLTHQIWLNFRNFFFWPPPPPPPPPQPPTVPPSPTPRAWPRPPNENPVWYVLYLSCVRRHKVWSKNLSNWLCNWNLMIFNDIWPFDPSPGPQGAGPKLNVPFHAPFMWATPHTKFGWIWSNGLGGDSVMDGRTDGQTEAIAISPTLFAAASPMLYYRF